MLIAAGAAVDFDPGPARIVQIADHAAVDRQRAARVADFDAVLGLAVDVDVADVQLPDMPSRPMPLVPPLPVTALPEVT